jgi:ABC-2 type transport system ATP-binding protein
MSNAISLSALTKQYKDVVAVDQLSFDVRRGEIFGFMGHNGAGKTTAIKMLLGLVRPTSGTATVLGLDIARDSLAIRARCGFLPGTYSLPREMTPESFLLYVAALFGIEAAKARKKIDELLSMFQLTAVARKKLGGFSTGMMQKVGVAQALINDPEVIFLDEPTSGLDPLGRHELLTHIKTLTRTRGTTVMFSTHILSDIESICESVAVMHKGKLVAYGGLSALKTEHATNSMDELYLKLARQEAA